MEHIETSSRILSMVRELLKSFIEQIFLHDYLHLTIILILHWIRLNILTFFFLSLDTAWETLITWAQYYIMQWLSFTRIIAVDGEYVEEGWVDKSCYICKKDTASEPRTVDKFGRYAHASCLDKSKSGNFFTRLFGNWGVIT